MIIKIAIIKEKVILFILNTFKAIQHFKLMLRLTRPFGFFIPS